MNYESAALTAELRALGSSQCYRVEGLGRYKGYRADSPEAVVPTVFLTLAREEPSLVFFGQLQGDSRH